jgi:ParB family transcriptional regulator, chromosome partitioning protein
MVGGHRRATAAILADLPTVPCFERPDLANSDPDQIAAMIAENVHRKNLTPDEEVAAYAQLEAFPAWTIERIARRTGRPTPAVRDAITTAHLDDQVRPHVLSGSLTLDQAALLEEWKDDPKAYQRLLRAAEQGYGFHYALAEEQAKKDRHDGAEATRETLRAEGVRLVGKPHGYPYTSVEQAVEDLRTPDGQQITVEAHVTCPGHAAFIDNDGEAVYSCQHPKEWGHQVHGYYQHLSEAEAAAKEAEDARREELRAQWEVATTARLSFLCELITKGKPPAKLVRTLTEMLCLLTLDAPPIEQIASLLTESFDPDHGDPAQAVEKAVTKTTEARTPLLLLAYVAAAAEENFDNMTRRWAYQPAVTARWLSLLESLGYRSPTSRLSYATRQSPPCASASPRTTNSRQRTPPTRRPPSSPAGITVRNGAGCTLCPSLDV